MSDKVASETTLAYCAGLFDGEGNISLHRHFSYSGRKQTTYGKHPNYRYRINIVVNQVYPEAIQVFLETFGGQIRFKQRSHGPNPEKAYSGRWSWEMGDVQAVRVLEQLLPYMRLKTAEAHLAIMFHATRLPSNGNGKGGRSRKLGRTPEELIFQEWAFEEMKRLKHLNNLPATRERYIKLEQELKRRGF